ncbi:SDR family oxidoreductase [Xanthomonadaceae bacterium JHOS43]|nr:SDR family oxidoreductase [Xanthomonadaceae bacterium JHOS43]MCX7564556.1 SDR family oxidoreductase [Xanthomonadaceae bacterium XH05]
MSTVLITGANRGIGLALTRLYRARGDEVIAVCRRSSAELEATGARVEVGIDVADAAAVAALPGRLGDVRIDVLLLNAGIFTNEKLGELDAGAFAAIVRQFEVNTLGPLRVTEALLGHLDQGARIGIITSRMGSITDNGSGGYYGYRASKAAVNAVGKSLALDLAPRGMAVALLHPGFVATEMVGGKGDISPEESASGLAARMDELTLERSGGFWHSNGSPLPW